MQKRNDYTALLSNQVWPKVEKRLLAGVKDSQMRNELQTVLANTRKSLLADTTVTNLNYIPKLVLPLVRRVFPKLIANNIISTQSLQGPMGVIRFMDAYIEDVNGNRIHNDSPFGDGNIYPWLDSDVEYSTAPRKVFFPASGTDTRTESEVTTTAAGVAGKGIFNGTLPFNYSEGSLELKVVKKEDIDSITGTVAGKDFKVTVKLGAQAYVCAIMDRNGVIQQKNKTVDKAMGFVDVKGTPVNGDPSHKTHEYSVTVTSSTEWVKGTAQTYYFFWEYRQDIEKNVVFNDGADGKQVNTMQFDIRKMTVDTVSRKLGAKYSFELMEDYENEFGEKFEDKMVDYLTTTILTEIDREVLNMLSAKACWEAEWDAQMPMTWTRGINEWYATITPVINMLSNTIYKKTSVGGATFLVCSPIVATVFQGLTQYGGKGNPIDNDMAIGATNVGTLANAYQVYCSPMCKDDEIILGFKGKAPEETGAIYAPYVPVQLQPITYNEGMQAVLARTRYWMGVVRPDYYAKIKVNNLTNGMLKVTGHQTHLDF